MQTHAYTHTRTDSGGPDLGELIHDYMAQMQAPLASQWRALAASLYGGRSLDKGGVSDMDILSQDSSVDPLKLQKAQKRLVKVCLTSKYNVAKFGQNRNYVPLYTCTCMHVRTSHVTLVLLNVRSKLSIECTIYTFVLYSYSTGLD